MARIRSVKPEFSGDKKVMQLCSRCGPFGPLVWLVVWTHCDDKGRHAWDTEQILLDHPAIMVGKTASDISDVLNECQALDLIRQYDHEGRRYFQVTNWAKHQRIDRPSKTGYLPDPPRALAAGSTSTRDGRRGEEEREREERKGSGREGREGEEERDARVLPAAGSGETQSVGAIANGLGLGLGLGVDKELEEARSCLRAYQAVLPQLQAATPFESWTAKRRAAWDRLRVEYGDERPKGSDDWMLYFSRVANSDFLMGREGNFKAELTWLLNPDNVHKVMEGQYDG